MDLADVVGGGGRTLRLDEKADYLRHDSRVHAPIGLIEKIHVGRHIHDCLRMRSVKPRSISPSCVFTETSRDPREVVNTIAPRSSELSASTWILPGWLEFSKKSLMRGASSGWL